jgi:hypothetical protein
VALSTGDGTDPRWTAKVPDLDGVTALGDQTMLVDATSNPHVWFLGKDGNPVYDRAARVGTRVTNSSVLLWSSLGSGAASVGLEGYTVGDTTAKPLGTADGIVANLCTWTTTVLACPAGPALAWWTFAD